jgi:lysophospholipase L1-like esterase
VTFAHLRRLARAPLRRLVNEPRLWEWQVRGYERSDRDSPPLPGGIVFTGSSTIALWKTLEEDLAPLPVLNRGFGGAQLDQVLHYAPRLLVPHAPRTVVLYAGDNDLAPLTGKTADSVARDFGRFHAWLRRELPETRLHVVSIKPTPLRNALRAEQQRANAAVRRQVEADPLASYVDVGEAMLGDDGRPRRSLYRWDGLHLSGEGYRVWASVLKPVLERDAAGVEAAVGLQPKGASA